MGFPKHESADCFDASGVSRMTVWHKKYIHALECFGNNGGSLGRIGGPYYDGTMTRIDFVGPGKKLNIITYGSGAWMDRLTFHLESETIKCGLSRGGGDRTDSPPPGYILGGFDVTYRTYINSLRAVWVPLSPVSITFHLNQLIAVGGESHGSYNESVKIEHGSSNETIST